MASFKRDLCINCGIILLIFAMAHGYLVVIDETTEDPNFPEMCVSPYWDRIVPVGYSYPVPRENLPNLHVASNNDDDVPFSGSSAAYLPPCEAVTCIKKRGHGRDNRYSLRIVGCENSIYSKNHDPTCNVYIPDQRLPYPMCCPQRTCSGSSALSFLYSSALNSRPRPLSTPTNVVPAGAGATVSGGGIVTGGGTIVSPISPISSPVQQRSAPAGEEGGVTTQRDGERSAGSNGAVKIPEFLGQALPPFPFAPILFPTVN